MNVTESMHALTGIAAVLIAAASAAEQGRQSASTQVFRTSVTRVEVSALVLDKNGEPVRGLIADDFQVFENGVPQIIRSFTPFTYDPAVLVLPEPVSNRGAEQAPAAPVASNFYASASRVFGLILDDLHIDVRRTQIARAAARRLIDQLSPTDLLFVTTTSSGESTGAFTRDRTAAVSQIDALMGQRLLDKTLLDRRYPGHNMEAGRLDHYLRLCASIRDVSLALRDVTGRRKTLLLLSEGSSFGAGMSDMASGQYVKSGSSRVMDEALSAAAAGNVAVYPINPAGLDTPDNELISGFGMVTADVLSQILTESRQSKEMLRDFAVLTGGVPLVDTNDTIGSIDRAMRDASSHYVLSYEPERAPKVGESRTIEVTVRRAGLRVLARRGYRVPSAKPLPPMKTPESLSPRLRTLLSGVMADDGLPMRLQAVPLTRKGKTTTVAVIVEVNGAAFANTSGPLRLEQGLLTIDSSGKAANGLRHTFDVTLSPAQRQTMVTTGLRSIWAVDLSPGRHQLRIASFDTATQRGGSLYAAVNVGNEKELPAGALIASRFLSMMPTVFVDQRLRPWTAVTPTATRVFPEGDVLTVIVPHASATPVNGRLTNGDGTIVWEGTGTGVAGAPAVQLIVPLDHVGTAVCDLTIESREGQVRTTIGLVPSKGGPR